MSRKKDLALLASGMVLGAALCGGSALASSGVTAQLIPQTFYVDGEAVSLTSCMVGGSNYVKLRDIGAAVGFEVYWDGTVQIRTDQPYTGVAPAETNQPTQNELDLTANMEIRLEMVRLINQVRRENGVPELTVNQALMDAAQDCAAQGFTSHDNQYEAQAGVTYGYPHGFGSNLTWFGGSIPDSIAGHAVNNWVNSPGHFQTIVRERYDHIGVGVAVVGGKTFCYMFAGDEGSVNFYS